MEKLREDFWYFAIETKKCGREEEMGVKTAVMDQVQTVRSDKIIWGWMWTDKIALKQTSAELKLSRRAGIPSFFHLSRAF